MPRRREVLYVDQWREAGGQLARAFGGSAVKEHVSSNPDVVVETTESEAGFIVLASDGLWKVMSNQEAVDTIKHIHDPQEAAVELIDEGIKRKNKDDISYIIARLH